MSAPSLLKREFFGGPADGDKRVATAPRMLVRVAGDDSHPTHEYTASDRGMDWQGVVNPRNVTVAIIRPGTER